MIAISEIYTWDGARGYVKEIYKESSEGVHGIKGIGVLGCKRRDRVVITA